MTCPSLLICSRYADGSLRPEAAAGLEQHLSACADCRARVEALQSESVALRSALQAADASGEVPAFAPRPTIPRPLGWLAWGALLAWVVNTAWISLVSAAAVPPWLVWLVPDVTGMIIELVMGLALQVFGGADLLSGGWRVVRIAALVSAAGIAFWWLFRGTAGQARFLCAGLGLAAAALVAPAPGHAFELRRDDLRVTVPAGETIDDTLVVAAENVLIEGTVTGDVIAMGEQVTVRGRVGGTLVAMAEVLNVEGEVGGNVIGMAESMTLRSGPLGANVYGAARTLSVLSDAGIAGNLLVAAAQAELHGDVARDLVAFARQVSLFGGVEGRVNAFAEQVNLEPGARVGGNLDVRVKSDDHLRVADGVVIGGETNVETRPEERSDYVTFDFYIGQTLRLLAAFLAGLVLFRLFPGLRRPRLDTGGEALTVMAVGSLVLIATPVLALLLTLTLIGAPIGIPALLLWLVALYLAGIVAAEQLGRLLLQNEEQGAALPLLLGLVILFIVYNVPLLGGLVRLAAIILGLGMIAVWIRGSRRAAA